MKTVWKKSDVNCNPLCVSIVDEIPESDIQLSMNIVATAVTVVNAVDNAFISFECWFAITKVNKPSDFVIRNRPTMSINTYFNGREADIGQSLRCLFLASGLELMKDNL